jgi:hypothetical protein
MAMLSNHIAREGLENISLVGGANSIFGHPASCKLIHSQLELCLNNSYTEQCLIEPLADPQFGSCKNFRSND